MEVDVPEVPIKSAVNRFSEITSAKKTNITFSISNDHGVSPAKENIENTSRGVSKKKIALTLALLIIVAIFAPQFVNSNETVSQSRVEIPESEGQIETPLEISSQTPTPETSPMVRATVQTRFLFTSTGIELIWDLTGIETIESVEVSATKSGGAPEILGSFDPSTRSLKLSKSDNEGLTSFTVTAITKNQQKVIAPTLDVRGKFDAN